MCNFIEKMDKFFDCFNVSSYTAARTYFRLNVSFSSLSCPFLYYLRLNWFLKLLIDYLDEWKKSIDEREGFDNDEKKLMYVCSYVF